MGLHERKTVGDSVKRATAVGLCAVVLWSNVRLRPLEDGVWRSFIQFEDRELETGGLFKILRNGNHHLDRFGGEFLSKRSN